MLNITILKTELASGKKIVKVNIRKPYDMPTSQILRDKGFQFNRTTKTYYKNFDRTSKQAIKEVIELMLTKFKWHNLEYYNLVKKKTNVNEVLRSLGVEL